MQEQVECTGDNCSDETFLLHVHHKVYSGTNRVKELGMTQPTIPPIMLSEAAFELDDAVQMSLRGAEGSAAALPIQDHLDIPAYKFCYRHHAAQGMTAWPTIVDNCIQEQCKDWNSPQVDPDCKQWDIQTTPYKCCSVSAGVIIPTAVSSAKELSDDTAIIRLSPPSTHGTGQSPPPGEAEIPPLGDADGAIDDGGQMPPPHFHFPPPYKIKDHFKVEDYNDCLELNAKDRMADWGTIMEDCIKEQCKDWKNHQAARADPDCKEWNMDTTPYKCCVVL